MLIHKQDFIVLTVDGEVSSVGWDQTSIDGSELQGLIDGLGSIGVRCYPRKISYYRLQKWIIFSQVPIRQEIRKKIFDFLEETDFV